MKLHPEYDAILRRLRALAPTAGPITLLTFRSTEPRYATERDLLTGEGSRLHGGRWNPPDSAATVYAARQDVTALAEARANFEYYGLDPADAWPRTLVAIDVSLGRALDLTSGDVRRSLRISVARMQSDDWREMNRRGIQSLTQTVGLASYDLGLEGLVVPACDGNQNIVWFPENLLATSRVTIRNTDKLTHI